MSILKFKSGATITFRRVPSEPFVSIENETLFDLEGYVTEIRKPEVGRYTGPRTKETTPDNWEPEE